MRCTRPCPVEERYSQGQGTIFELKDGVEFSIILQQVQSIFDKSEASTYFFQGTWIGNWKINMLSFSIFTTYKTMNYV